MKAIALLTAYMLLTLSALGQGVLQGSVLDENHEPLVGANILLRETGTGTIADKSGNFRITNLKAGSYNAEISFIGYLTKIIPVDIQNTQTSTMEATLTAGGIQLADILVTGTQDQPVNTLSQVDIKLRPINTSQDILRMVPGLFIAQHAGGGKAEQIFLRGFDADHGTDINVEVDGLPVNMVSHAHGQGYADLHFLIPELVSYVDFDKGPYFADRGDFNTAGYVAFQTKNKLDRNFFKMEGGSFGAGRAVAGVNIPTHTNRSSAYIASEFYRSDGFFVNSQKFTRVNVQSKFNTRIGNGTHLTAGFTAFDSKWDASGQIPDRAVENGMITRYGSLDPTEGGNTGRSNMYVKSTHDLGNGSSLENQLYAVKYNFSLFSNFTFFLKDSVNGDQIHQQEGRWVYGYKSRYTRSSSLWGKNLKTDIGAGMRYDVIDNIALSHTTKRVFLNDIKRGDIREGNVNAYVSETLSVTDKLSVNAAVRFDYFYFSYHNALNSVQPASVGKPIVSPKLNLNYQITKRARLFVRTGTGFHSNDARVVVAQAGKETLPKAYAMDVGAELKITPRILVHTAFWRLDLDQEFVYVGDDGIVEPSGKTQREGVDLSVRYQLTSWLFADIDVNVTKPRSKSIPEGKNYIPLAPTTTTIGGLSFRKGNGFHGSFRYRYLGDRPANNDNTIVAKGYLIADAIVNYSRPGFEIGISIENMFNATWKEAQFDTESRLRNETASVSEIHFTPGTPFSLKIRFTKYF